MKASWTGSAPSSTLQPPIVLISSSTIVDEQQQDHDHARRLHDRLVAVGVRDHDAARAAIRFLAFPNRRGHRGKPYNLERSPCAQIKTSRGPCASGVGGPNDKRAWWNW